MNVIDRITSDNLIEEVISKANSVGASIYIYGCGNSGIQISKRIRDENIIAFVVDDNYWDKYGNDYKVEGKHKVVPLSKMEKDDQDGIFIVSIAPNELLEGKISQYCKNKKIYYLDGQQLLFPKMKYEYVAEKADIINELERMLVDKCSKDLLISYLNARITGDLTYMKKYGSETRKDVYFDPEIFAPRNNEVFIDCGAYNGDSIENFVKFTNGDYDRIIAFEPNSDNFSRLLDLQKKYGRIDVIKKGCWNVQEKLHFNNERGPMSEINGDAEEIIEVDRIDKYCGDYDVSLIKMNIEGSEYNALLGAEKTIKKSKPRLAISVYHRPEDLFVIPQLIRSFVSEYQFKLRIYSYGTGLLVLYGEVK